MKRFSIFCAALLTAAASFATVTYEADGGVTNEYGWQSKGDMFAAFMTDAGAKDFKTLDYYMQQADPLGAPNICSALADASPALKMEKWAWLKAYVEAAHTAQAADGASALPADGTGAAWRYAVGAFFVSGQRTGWPISANFAHLGLIDAYMPAWKAAFANPTEPKEPFTLNAPYKADATFAGWYTTADFAGDRVFAIDSTFDGKTLYAKWIAAVPTLTEVSAMADDTKTQAYGIVTYIRGKNVYIQDVTGGMLLFLSADATFAVGEKILVEGTKTTYGGAPEMKDITVVSKEPAAMLAPLSFSSLAVVKDKALSLFGMRVKLLGLKIAKYDDKGNAYVTDGKDTAQCYYMVLNQTEYPVGRKVNLVAIVGYYNKFQFVGDINGFEIALLGKKDSYEYPARGENGEYTLENKWVISKNEDNFDSNKPGPDNFVRGMAAKDGKMYFINRSDTTITVVDAASGDKLDPIKIIGEHLFEATDSTGAYAPATTLPFNDIKFDGAGNCLIGCCTGTNSWFFIYKVDLATGKATELIKERLYDNPDYKDNGYRFDAFGVYGDVNNNAVIMATDANSFNVYKWNIANGKVTEDGAQEIPCIINPKTDNSLLIKDTVLTVENFGTAPQTFPVSEDLFYVDGWSTLPMLFDMTGALKDDFVNSPKGVAIANNEGDTCKMNTGHNGLVEFQVGDEYFLLMAATNTAVTPNSAFALYKFADEAKEFAGLEPMWYFPANGMGAESNGCRTAVPSVEVKGNVATIYLYANNNGYAVYTFTGKESTAVDNIDTVKIEAKKVVENGQLYIIKNGVKYTVLGSVAE